MTKQNNQTSPNEQTELENQLEQLEQQLATKKAEQEKVATKLFTLEQAFQAVKNNWLCRLLNPVSIKRMIRTVGAYILGRRNRKQLYSPTYKRKQAANDLKIYKKHLYDLGFTEKALSDLENLYSKTKNRYLKQAIAWELALWYTNTLTEEGAQQALPYLEVAKYGEKDQDQRRRIAIIQAECYERMKKIDQANDVLKEMLAIQEHPDLYLGLANLAATINERARLINQAYQLFDLQPITFASHSNGVTYDDLRTEPLARTITDGPKVSVILPAYNSEVSIQIAIESILTQTWQNIELLAVDDCSTDGTKAVIEAYAKRDKRVKALSTPKNSGPYVARNIALQQATGEFVTVNDADDWSHAEKIETQVKHLIENKDIMANTSAHARLTEELKLYRRGTPGHYIFSNMSSLMFRRIPVMEKLGYWDSVRFAADGEFKRRLIKVFGKEKVIDLNSGPLSLPRQTVSSLTGSSAFGYSGFFMGARKEYVASFEFYQQNADILYYSYPQTERLFPVPEPMWPSREEKQNGYRSFDVVIAADFEAEDTHLLSIEQAIVANKKLGRRTGLVQMKSYDLTRKKEYNVAIRRLIDGEDVQVLVYGEKINCDIFIIINPAIMNEKQKYIPKIDAHHIFVIVNQLPKITYNGKQKLRYNIRQCLRHIMNEYDKRGRWYPLNETIRKQLVQGYQKELQSVKLATENWFNNEQTFERLYSQLMDEFLIDDNPYDLP